MRGDISNNMELERLIGIYPSLTPAQLSEITGFAYGAAYGWTVPPENSNHRVMPNVALRLLKLEMCLVKGSWKVPKTRRRRKDDPPAPGGES